MAGLLDLQYMSPADLEAFLKTPQGMGLLSTTTKNAPPMPPSGGTVGNMSAEEQFGLFGGVQSPTNMGLLNPVMPPFSGISGKVGAIPEVGFDGAKMRGAVNPQPSPALPLMTQQPDMPAPGAVAAGPLAMPPMPPERPAGLGFNRPAPEAPTSPMQLSGARAPDAVGTTTNYPPAPDQGGGFFDKLGTLAGSIYGGGKNPGDNLIALGAGLASGPNWGSGLMKGMSMVNANALTAKKTEEEQKRAAGQAMLAQHISQQSGGKIPPSAALGIIQSGAGNQFLSEQFRKQEQFRPLTDPAERARMGIDPNDRQPYQINQDGKIAAVGTPSTNVSVNSAANPILDGLGKQVIEGRATASSAGNALRTLNEARTQLDNAGGFYSGFGAERRLDVAKLGALFGITDPRAIANTETFKSVMGGVVLDAVKGLGAGSGISNADREFAERMAGGSINLDEASIRRAIDITERATKSKITSHNELVDKVITQIPNMAPMAGALRIEMPEPYKPPKQTQQQQNTPTPGWRRLP